MNTTTAAAPELPPLDPAIRTQVQDQCRAVVGLCKAIAELHSDYEKVIALNSMSPTLLQMTGERTAKLMEYLGDVLNGQDATTDDDAWMDPIFEKAHAMFPIERAALAAKQPAASTDLACTRSYRAGLQEGMRLANRGDQGAAEYQSKMRALTAGIAAERAAPAVPAASDGTALVNAALAEHEAAASALRVIAAGCVAPAEVANQALLRGGRAFGTGRPAASGEPAAQLLPVYSVTLKGKAQIKREIPRERQGWWADVACGQTLKVRDATADDLARCNLSDAASKDPANYVCEAIHRGCLVSREALANVYPPEPGLFYDASKATSERQAGTTGGAQHG